MAIEEKVQQQVYDLLLQDRYQGQELTQRDQELLELEVRLNERIDRGLLEDPQRVPKAVYFIIPNEFGERFCYYGIRPLLINFFKGFCGTDDVGAKVHYHTFVYVTYFCPLIGAALSDSFLGKYRTIVSLSVLYFIGTLLFAIFTIPGILGIPPNIPIAGPLGALMLIALGTGGIKPCVSTHGGDQYLPHQKDGIDWFFSIFYTSINVGALISGNITPAVRKNVQCFGEYDCYFYGTIMCSIMFALVTAVFIFGVRYYRIVPPVGEFLPWKCLKVTVTAGVRYLSASSEERKRKKSWLDFAEEDYGAPFVEETRLFGRVIYMILPMMFFWMIYDQTASEWQSQYVLMDDRIGSIQLSSDQFQQINSFLIIIMVPGLGYLYPIIERRLKIRCTPLRRMSLGFFLVIVAFVISGLLQISVEKNAKPTKYDLAGNVVECHNGCVHSWWTVPQWVIVSLGEALASPTGLLFCYEESGKALKAQSSSMWLLMVSFGSMIIAAVEKKLATSVSGPAKYFVYSGMGLAFNIWFIIQAYFYKTRAQIEQERALEEEEKAAKIEN
ncbi:uncharacterized protein VTP21DRAFT_11384 [Calcarisporiella thermophila]|uniref:uncharacterized protein n=1 Tax=Calcarisporiella thermophila TaxID=911321 RepID=UPI003744485F